MIDLGCLCTRSDFWSLCYYDGEYYVVRSKPGVNVNSIASIYSLEKRFGFGRYGAVVRTFCTKNGQVFPFGFENHHGFAEEGILAFLLKHDRHYAMSSLNGKTIKEEIMGQDWTGETFLEIGWKQGEATFLVNGEAKTTQKTDMREGNWFMETISYNLPREIYGKQKAFGVKA